ncbi:MAG TPA: hypothetical protein VNZ26_14790, partial [Vicinamibacterales bacterium]|nr:hypothetical protein [Vicinamibacterales bacterium]
MSARQELNSYVSQLERRLRLSALSRGAAILGSAALVATTVLVLVASAFAFSDISITGTRVALLISVVSAIVFGVGLPLWRVNRTHAVRKAEEAFPEFQQRLVTLTEREHHDPFLDLLAADTLEVAQRTEPAALAPSRTLFRLVGIGVAALAVLAWMIVARPGFLG